MIAFCSFCLHWLSDFSGGAEPIFRICGHCSGCHLLWICRYAVIIWTLSLTIYYICTSALFCFGKLKVVFWNRCVLWEGVKEFRNVPVGEEHADVPVRHRHHPCWSFHDWRSTGHWERFLIRIHTMGVLCSQWVLSMFIFIFSVSSRYYRAADIFYFKFLPNVHWIDFFNFPYS